MSKTRFFEIDSDGDLVIQVPPEYLSEFQESIADERDRAERYKFTFDPRNVLTESLEYEFCNGFTQFVPILKVVKRPNPYYIGTDTVESVTWDTGWCITDECFGDNGGLTGDASKYNYWYLHQYKIAGAFTLLGKGERIEVPLVNYKMRVTEPVSYPEWLTRYLAY